jgi:4,4'-diaponeurosporenoate glycosyltransferase
MTPREFISIFLIVCGWLCGFLFFFKIPLCRTPALGSDLKPLRLSIIIPARNEENNLPRLLDSIAAQSIQPLEVLVVNDHSQDRTAAAALERGARVIPAEALPPEWTGKTWACHQGAQKAQGDVLLFLDADLWFEEQGLEKIFSAFRDSKGVLSVGPYHWIEKRYEELSAFFNLAMFGGIDAFSLWGRRGKHKGLFGQALAVDRRLYEQVGGHAAVRGRILENFYLARLFREQNIPLEIRGGKGTLAMRMFPAGLKNLVQGWIKAFASGAAQTPAWTLFTIVFWMVGAVSAFLFPLSRLWTSGPAAVPVFFVVLYFVYVLQIFWFLRRIGRFSFWTALGYPLFLGFYLVLFHYSLFLLLTGKKPTWKGRQTPGQ